MCIDPCGSSWLAPGLSLESSLELWPVAGYLNYCSMKNLRMASELCSAQLLLCVITVVPLMRLMKKMN